MGRRILVVVCVVAIAVALYLALPRRGRITEQMSYQPRVCEACGHRFDGPSDPIVTPCPQCGKRAAVRAQFYQCRDCGESFEAFRTRLADEGATKLDPMKPPKLLHKREGGQWTPSLRSLGPFQCPKCKSANVRPPRPQ